MIDPILGGLHACSKEGPCGAFEVMHIVSGFRVSLTNEHGSIRTDSAEIHQDAHLL